MTPNQPPRHVAVAGAGGATGSAVLHGWLGSLSTARVTVLTTRRFLQMPPRMADAVVHDNAWAAALPVADHAVIVFGTVRRAREVVYWQPARAQLLPLAAAWRAQGVRSLEVVFADGQLSADERDALDRLGFDRVTQRRQTAVWVAPSTGSWPERLAAWMIATVLTAMQQVIATAQRRDRR